MNSEFRKYVVKTTNSSLLRQRNENVYNERSFAKILRRGNTILDVELELN